MVTKKLLSDYSISELAVAMNAYGEKHYRAKQLTDWITDGARYSEMTNIPQEFLFRLAAEYNSRGVEIENYLISKLDGTRKYLFKLLDGNFVEGVLMRYQYGNTFCVSSQVGCKMNCAFCASGLCGFTRDLSPGEIIGQVIAANRQLMREYERAKNAGKTKAEMTRAINNIVFMGSGEPLDNYDNVTKAIKLLISPDGLNISQRNITLSTSGMPDRIKNLADDGFVINLTISLHAPDDEIRREIMPAQKDTSIAKIIEAARYYFMKTGRRFTFEYALIAGVNDGRKHAEELAELVRGLPCHINIINLNSVKERNMKRSDAVTAKHFMEVLQMKGVAVTVRRSLGADIDGACGQLRNKFTATQAEQEKVSSEYEFEEEKTGKIIKEDEVVESVDLTAVETQINRKNTESYDAEAPVYEGEDEEIIIPETEEDEEEPAVVIEEEVVQEEEQQEVADGTFSAAEFDATSGIDSLFDDLLKDFINTQQAEKEAEKRKK